MSAWQPIETAPKDGTMVLLGMDFNHTIAHPYIIAGWYESGLYDRCWYDITDERVSPTHWTPLPPLPSSRTETSA